MKLKFDRIRIDGGTQTRAAINEDAVCEYMDSIKNGAKFPPLTVFYDGQDYWLADGFHRYRAFVESQIFEIEADVCQGSRRDAILYSVGANAEHGLPRSNADKRRAVATLLNDQEWQTWTDREIARRCRVGHDMVGDLRKSSLAESASEKNPSQPITNRKFVSKHGTVSTMNTAKIGKSRPQKPGLSSKAFKPTRGHAEIVPMLSISLPLNNPAMGARALLNRFEHSYVVALHEELTKLLEEQQ